jgi:hypothetical protein
MIEQRLNSYLEGCLQKLVTQKVSLVRLDVACMGEQPFILHTPGNRDDQDFSKLIASMIGSHSSY